MITRIKKKENLFFIIIAVSISFLLFFSFSGYWSITHGPLYFFIGDHLANFGILGSTLFVENETGQGIFNSVRTFQIGIAYIHAISIFLLGKYWYIFFIFITSIIWTITISRIIEFLYRLEFEKIDAYLISFLIFFQPYNLNQLANFSNESIYFPLLIYYFIFTFDLINQNLKKFINKNKFKFTLFLIFLLFGSFFRIHHLIFFGSLILFLLIKKKYSHFWFFTLFLFLTLTIKIILLNYTGLNGSVVMVFSFLDSIYENFVHGKILSFTTFGYEELATDQIHKTTAVQKSILYSISNLSFYLFINKFVGNYYIAISISLILGLIPLISIIQSLKNQKKDFSILSLIFIFFSCLFIFILPIFENSYHLPISFLIIIFNFSILKKYLKKYFYKFLILVVTIFTIFITIVFNENIKFKNIEIYSYRDYIEKVKSFKNRVNTKNSLVYFNERVPSMPEIYRWYLKFPICNYGMKPDDCMKIRNIKNIKNIYIIKTEKYSDIEISNKLNFNNFYIAENIDDYFVLNEK